jgi:acyloxyacyl hydrolase
MLEDKYTPDVICNTIGVCNNESGQTCNIFPVPKSASGARMSKVQFEQHVAEAKAKYNFKDYKFNVCDWIPHICNIGDHKPVFDQDGDLFSNIGPLRGHNWRGRDCDDTSNAIFPGRLDADIGADTNCNGIFGVDPVTNVPYE